MGSGKRNFSEFREALGQVEFFMAINARARNRFVEGNFGRPLGDGVSRFLTFIKANLYGMDFVEEFGRAFCEQIGESRGRAGVNKGGAMLLHESLGVAELFGLERVARKVGAEVEVVGAKAEGGAENEFVEDGSGGVDD